MNLVSLALLLSSLTAAGVWSPHPEAEPNPHPTYDDNNHILREGHSLIVVEYERQVDPAGIPDRFVVDDTNDNTHEPAAPVLSRAYQTEPQGSAKSLVCDAYGVCKEVVSGLIGKGKEKTSEKAAEIEVAAKETMRKADSKASELKKSIERTVWDAAEKTEQLKDAVIEKASTSEECAKKAADGSIDKAKEAAQELSRNVSDLARKAGDKAQKTVEEVSGNLTDILRRAKEVAFDAAAYFWAFESGKTAASTLHFLGFATAYGTCIWVTFFSSNVLAASLPRLQFGMAQSKLYPMYFRVVAYGIALSFVAHFLGRDRRILAETVQGYNLLAALAMVMANMFLLEPRATKVMFERMKVEKEEGRGIDMADATTAELTLATSKKPSTPRAPATTTKVVGDEQQAAKSELVQLNGKLRRLNTFSSFLNILAVMSLSWHLVHLARQMQHKC